MQYREKYLKYKRKYLILKIKYGDDKTEITNENNLSKITNENNLTQDAIYYDYASSANPIVAKLIPPVPYKSFNPNFFKGTESDILHLDASKEMNCPGPATSPALLANFVRIVGTPVKTAVNATSQLFYVFQGSGYTKACGQTIYWEQGDFMVFPAHGEAVHYSDNASFYWVHDAPLLNYLGAIATKPQFKPTVFKHSKAVAKLDDIIKDPVAGQANRVSVLLANSNFPQTRTITHTLWAMFGILPRGKVQFPHRHESVALDFVINCKPGCYTIIGTELDPETGMIKNGHRENWESGASFITPAGYWHSHHNESDEDAHVLPIQDAGLHTYLRTLDILYSHVSHDRTPYISQRP